MAIHPIDLSTIYSQMDKIGQINASQVQTAHQANRENLERAANLDYEKNFNFPPEILIKKINHG